VKIKSPCFTALAVLPVISKGEMIADIIAVIGSIDIVMGELDR
jgi:NADH:ubiquinone oxidoreductase subunit D